KIYGPCSKLPSTKELRSLTSIPSIPLKIRRDPSPAKPSRCSMDIPIRKATPPSMFPSAHQVKLREYSTLCFAARLLKKVVTSASTGLAFHIIPINHSPVYAHRKAMPPEGCCSLIQLTGLM